MMDPSRHTFQTNFAFILSFVTLLLMAVLSLVFSPSSSTSYSPSTHRWLDESNNNSNSNDDASSNTDYSSYSCGYIYDETPDPGSARCQFARTCNQGAGIWAPFVYCSSSFSTTFLVSCISPLMCLWLVLLFRMLGSTAEDFFSPALEMFSTKLGLPPRFAGVTLLALGNGAADVSATVSAITSDRENGYKLALGALTGAAMVIGCVVSASVVLVAGGVPCRGALVRDVTALTVAVLVVWKQLATGSIGPQAVTIFLMAYAIFVALVLAADIYHRAVVLPRAAAIKQQRERERQVLQGQNVQANSSDNGLMMDPNNNIDNNIDNDNDNDNNTDTDNNIRLDNLLRAFSNYENCGVEGDDLTQDRPVVLHGTHGILHGDGLGNIQYGENGQLTGDNNGNNGDNGDNEYATSYAMLQDTLCVSPGTGGIPATNWSGAFHDGRKEILDHAGTVWEDIVWNGDVNIVSKFLLLCELPFTTLRKLTVPIPCEGFYVRAMVALSVAISPIWFVYYLWNMHDINLLFGRHESGWLYFLVLELLFLVGSVSILRYAPGGEGVMSLHLATPIALLGFIMAATWIDTIADNLVNLLEFVGTLMNIPSPIVGLTILAWGNSMGDLSANMTMARKGLANSKCAESLPSRKQPSPKTNIFFSSNLLQWP
jgi:sodium/potassium/calcium exchanger 6